jgi:hypothetical protein
MCTPVQELWRCRYPPFFVRSRRNDMHIAPRTFYQSKLLIINYVHSIFILQKLQCMSNNSKDFGSLVNNVHRIQESIVGQIRHTSAPRDFNFDEARTPFTHAAVRTPIYVCNASSPYNYSSTTLLQVFTRLFGLVLLLVSALTSFREI